MRALATETDTPLIDLTALSFALWGQLGPDATKEYFLWLDPGESPADCARRELREETGCQAQGVEHLFTMYTTPGFTDEKIHVFMAVGLTRGEVAREADEFIEVETMPLSRALSLVERGEIQDAKTALALMYAAGFRAGR